MTLVRSDASPAQDDDDVLRTFFPGGDEAALVARATDWAATPLGPPSTWSTELGAAIRTVMPSNVPMLLWWGPELTQVYNEAYRALVGAKHPRSMGQRAHECWAEVWDELGPMTSRVVATGLANHERELPLVLLRHGFDEETYWTFSYSPVRSADGSVLGIFVATTDVTVATVESHRLDAVRQLAVRSSADFTDLAAVVGEVLDVLADNAAAVPFAAVYLPDGTGRLVLQGSYGVPCEVSDLPEVAAEDGAEVVSQVATSRSPRLVSYPGEMAASDEPSSRRPTSMFVLPLGVPGAQLGGVVALGLNPRRPVDESSSEFVTLLARQVSGLLTEVRAGVAERARTAALAQLDASKSAFFANVSHEFRTPLTVTLAALRELRASTLTTEQEQHVDAVERASRRLDRLVDTLLDFARAEAGRLVVDLQPVDLAELTRDVGSMFRSAVESAGLALDVEVQEVGWVAADREAWSRVVANLLSNAYRFTPSGAIRLVLHREGEHVRLEVGDTGPGMAAEEVARVFQRFHQGAGRPVRGAAGTGIGLALVKDLVSAHGGEVDLESEPGHGTTVRVVVPAPPVPAPAGTGRAARPSEAEVGLFLDDLASAAAQDVDARREGAPRVLLVEDDPDVRAYLARLLGADGWSVTPVEDVPSALAVGTVPDLVLSDIMLPGASGLDLVRVLRREADWATVPIVLLTARHGPVETAEGLEAGADDYVSKPFEPRELLARLRTHHELAKDRRGRVDEALERTRNLEIALETNRTIGMALGILMAQFRVTSDQAFAVLRRQSNDSNRRLGEVAAEVVHTGRLPEEGAAPRRASEPVDGAGGASPAG